VLWLCLLGGLAGGARLSAQQPDESELRWYKGNLHTHSLWSDGNDFPEMIVDWYVQHAYDFLGLSDHNILSRGEKWVPEDQAARRGAIDALQRYQARFGNDWVETREQDGKIEIRLKTLDEFRSRFEKPGEFLLLQAEEITDRFGQLPIHINANNLVELIRPQGGNSVRETMANNLIAVEQQGLRWGRPILAHLNHPNFGYAVTAEDMAAVEQERFFEIYNGHPDVAHLGDAQHAGLERMWDIANTIRLGEMHARPLYGLATDDSHNYFGNRGASPGRGWVMVPATELTPEAIIQGLDTGRFYSSSGVTLQRVHYDPQSRVYQIDIAPDDGVEYVTEFIGTLKSYDRSVQPVRDQDGKELPVTRQYSTDVGKVLQRVEGVRASYRLTGDELYVRAVVSSSRKHQNPSWDGQLEQAWTQPVGWVTAR